MSKMIARLLLMVILTVQVCSVSVMANAIGGTESPTEEFLASTIEDYGDQEKFIPKTRKPYEYLVDANGHWLSEYWEPRRLTFGYQGDFTEVDTEKGSSFEVPTKTRVLVITIATQGRDSDIGNFMILDERGNVFTSFTKVTNNLSIDTWAYTDGETATWNEEGLEDEALVEPTQQHTLTPNTELILPAGSYTLLYDVDNTYNEVDAFYIKGYKESAYQSYLKKVNKEGIKWEEDLAKQYAEEAKELEEAFVERDPDLVEGFGDADLQDLYEDFLNDWDDTYEPEGYEEPAQLYAPSFQIEAERMISQIILDTYNDGQGALPGIMTIYNVDSEVMFSVQAHGASLGETSNGMWVAYTEEILPKGLYFIEPDDPSVLSYDEEGNPLFYVETSELKPPLFNYTGTYSLDLDVVKTFTLAGAVSNASPTIALKRHELAILDKGDYIEVIGDYEGFKFSQNCEVLERSPEGLVCAFNWEADLSNLPYKAAVGAGASLTFEHRSGENIYIVVDGIGTYSRAESKEKGADYNMYAIKGEAHRVRETPPMYVMAALAKLYGIGNIPGPDTPIEAAVGLLFPALAGVVVSILQDLLKPKPEPDPDDRLSVGERAMKRSNNSFGDGLVSEEDKKAWGMMAEALGSSGGDAEDAVSLGDNELIPEPVSPSNEPDVYETAELEPEYEEPVMEEPFDVSTEAADSGLLEAPETPIEEPEPGVEAVDQPLTMVIPSNTKGSTKLVEFDPETGEWFDPETNATIDLEAHEEFLGDEADRLGDFRTRNKFLDRTKQTSMDDIMREIDQKYEADMAAIDDSIKARHRQNLANKQRWLEVEQKQANEANALGRILSSSVGLAGHEILDTGKSGLKTTIELYKSAAQLKKDLTDLDILRDTYDGWSRDIGTGLYKASEGAKDAYKDVQKDPSLLYKVPKKYAADATKKVLTITGNTITTGYKVVKAVGNGIYTTVTDPKKAFEFVKDSVGVENFENSLDPNRSLTSRIGQVFIGTGKLYTTIISAGQLSTAAKASAKTLAGLSDDVLRVGAKAMANPSNTAKQAASKLKNYVDDVLGTGVKTTSSTRGVSRYSKGLRPKPSYTSGGLYDDIPGSVKNTGMTRQSQAHMHKVASEELLQIKVRPTTRFAKGHLDSGYAVSKQMDVKNKTGKLFDELLGGPPNSEGLVLHYKPKLPPREVLRKMSPKSRRELFSTYRSRSSEYAKYSGKYAANGSKYEVVGKRLKDKGSGKWITGDNDGAEFVNFDGTAAPKAAAERARGKLARAQGAEVNHNDVMDWKVDDKSFDFKAKVTMINDMKSPKGGVVSFGPDGIPVNNIKKGPIISAKNLDRFTKGDYKDIEPFQLNELKKIARDSGMEVLD